MSNELAIVEPWARLSDEPAAWFVRFNTYLLLGPGRSLNAAATAYREKERGLPGRIKANESWCKAAVRWRWVERSAAHDEHIARLEQAEYAQRRRELRKRLCEVGEKMIAKGTAIIELPHVQEITKEVGGKVVHIHKPVNFAMSDGTRLVVEGSKVLSQALDPQRPDLTVELRAGQGRVEPAAAHLWLLSQEGQNDADDGGEIIDVEADETGGESGENKDVSNDQPDGNMDEAGGASGGS